MLASLPPGCLAGRASPADLKAKVASTSIDTTLQDANSAVDGGDLAAGDSVAGDSVANMSEDGALVDVNVDATGKTDSANFKDADAVDAGFSDAKSSTDTLRSVDTATIDSGLDAITIPDANPATCVIAADCTLAVPASSLGPCEKVACLAGACGKVEVDAAPCDDGDVCTLGDNCVVGTCQPGMQKQPCADTNPCTTDKCNAKAGCVHSPNAGGCDDGNGCTVNDTCGGGGCKSGPLKDCADGDACTTDACSATDGSCSHVAVVGCGGNCTTSNDCPSDGKVCTTESCTSGKCGATANSGVCDDGDACTTSDACGGGSCKGTPMVCATTWPCHVSACVGGSGKCAVKLAANGTGCGNKGTCSDGACIWTDSGGRQWGLVPGGTFQMGCNATLDKSCNNNEKPQHAVTISSSYWLGLYEVTVSNYKTCVDVGTCTIPNSGGTYDNWGKPGREQHP